MLEVIALEVGIRKDYVEIEDGNGATTSVLTVKKNDYGLFQQVYDFGTVAADLLLDAQASGQDIGRWGYIFRQPGTDVVVASGPLTTLIASEGRRNGVAEDAMSSWGVTDVTHLRERITFPDPEVDIAVSDGVTTHAWNRFVRRKTGPAESVALDFLRENIGPLSIPRRRLGVNQGYPSGVLQIPASLGRGPVITYTTTANENVLTVMQECFAATDLSFDVVQTGPGELSVVIHERVVREGIIWGVEAGTAAGVAVKAQRRPKTTVINSGSGDDETTIYVRRDAPPPTGGFSEVREEFIKGSGSLTTEDQSATDTEPARTAEEINAETVAELCAEADEELIEDGPELGLDVEPDPSAPWRLGIDYQLNDVVIGMFRDTPFEVPLQQVILRHEDGTLVEEPSAGFGDDDDLGPVLNDIYRALRRARRRS